MVALSLKRVASYVKYFLSTRNFCLIKNYDARLASNVTYDQ